MSKTDGSPEDILAPPFCRRRTEAADSRGFDNAQQIGFSSEAQLEK
jgi:hypothetical protein